MHFTDRLSVLQNRLGLILSLLVLSVGLWLSLTFSPYSIKTEAISINLDRDRILVGRLYNPAKNNPVKTSTPYPTIVLWHGVSSSKEMMEPLAVELARHGIAALTFDSGGFGESYRRNHSEEENLQDAQAVMAYVDKYPDRFDLSRLGIGGHSMGASTAIGLAITNSKIRVTLDLGMNADVTKNLPANLFMGIGLYEEFHTPADMREMLQQATSEITPEFSLKGDFLKTTARQLVISATADHLTEPFDPTLIQEAVSFATQALQVPKQAIALTMPQVMLGWFFVFVGSSLTVGYGLRDQSFLRSHPRLLAVGVIAIVVILIYLGANGSISSRTATSIILLCAVLLPVATYAVKVPQAIASFFRAFGLYIGAFLVAYAFESVVIRSGDLLARPSYLLGLPQFIVYLPIALIYSRVQEFSAAMFPVYSYGLVPSWQLALLFLPELVFPSLFLSFGTRGGSWLVRWLRQPLRLNWQKPNGKTLTVLGVAVLLLVALVAYQASLGLVSLTYALLAFRVLLQLFLIPAFLFIIILRSRQFQRLENWFV
jgi:pimeloyl-ACP methyl ester carboxylesterase